MIPDPRCEDRNVEVLAFYYPGEEAPCVRVCHVPFLGNLWPLRDEAFALAAMEPLLLVVERQARTYRFGNSEAAHQVLKFGTVLVCLSKLTAEAPSRSVTDSVCRKFLIGRTAVTETPGTQWSRY